MKPDPTQTPPLAGRLRIANLQPEWVEAAKHVIYTVVREYYEQGLRQPELTELMKLYDAEHRIEDVDCWLSQYQESGVFLVLLDSEQVVGTGGIKKVSEDTAELKRMWFLPPYRGRGLGKQMAEMLIACAAGKGYRRLVLTADARQVDAIKLFERLGFSAFTDQNDSKVVEMQKVLR